MPVVVFDLEGPLSPDDHAYEVARRYLPDGDRLFEVLSAYDDALYFEVRREGYEPGGTLVLLLPFLKVHGVTDEDLKRVSDEAGLTPGAEEAVAAADPGYVASTSYRVHAVNVAGRVGIPEDRVRCTDVSLDELPEPGDEERKLVERIEEEVLSLYPPDDWRELVERLDPLFFEELPSTRLGEACMRVEVCGGGKKARAVEWAAGREGVDVGDVVCVGDSITDVEMMRFVREEGGLAVAFNGNRYCVPEADVAVAAGSLDVVVPLFEAFDEGGKEAALEVAETLEGVEGVLVVSEADERELKSFVRLSEDVRERVRGEAGRLG